VLLALSAAGEIGVGVFAILMPAAVVALLAAAPIEGVALMVARMAGVAIVALGIDWWRARGQLDVAGLRRVAPGFLGYNLGIGLLFLARALELAGQPIPWIVAIAHLAFAAVLAVLLAQLPHGAGSSKAQPVP
jgi:hypothetical protein